MLDEFDDGLVRRLIEQVTVRENGTFTVEFKSGTTVEVKNGNYDFGCIITKKVFG